MERFSPVERGTPFSSANLVKVGGARKWKVTITECNYKLDNVTEVYFKAK